MIVYQRRDLTTSTDIGEPGPLPYEIDGLMDADLANLSWVDPLLGYTGIGFFPAVVADPIVVPEIISRMQARLALFAAQKLDILEAYMDLSDTPRAYRIYWEAVSELHRDHPLVEAIGIIVGLSGSEIDALFIAGKAIV